MGAHVAGLYMGVAAYADDLVLIAPSRHAMQLMPVPLQLCGQDLPWVDTATHLGHELWNMTLMLQEQGLLTRM